MTQENIPITTNAESRPAPPELNIEDYRDELAELEFSPEQEREILECLWEISKMVVDAKLGLDATSTVLSAIARKIFLGELTSQDKVEHQGSNT